LSVLLILFYVINTLYLIFVGKMTGSHSDLLVFVSLMCICKIKYDDDDDEVRSYYNEAIKIAVKDSF